MHSFIRSFFSFIQHNDSTTHSGKSVTFRSGKKKPHECISEFQTGLFPGLGGVLTRAYEALLKQQRFSEPSKKYPYVFADLKPTTDNNYRMRSGLLPTDQKFVCLLNIT